MIFCQPYHLEHTLFFNRSLQELDAALEPILLQQKFKQGGQDMIRLGDNTVPYNDEFRLVMITKLPNPEYAPEVQARGCPALGS